MIQLAFVSQLVKQKPKKQKRQQQQRRGPCTSVFRIFFFKFFTKSNIKIEEKQPDVPKLVRNPVHLRISLRSIKLKMNHLV